MNSYTIIRHNEGFPYFEGADDNQYYSSEQIGNWVASSENDDFDGFMDDDGNLLAVHWD
jgi:hypothetical protein